MRARRLLDWHEPLLTQVALARFITEDHLARHVRRMSKVYARRRATLLDTLERASGIFTEVISSVAGLHVACRMKNPREIEALRRKAVARGVANNTIREFSGDEGATEIAFGFGMISEKGVVKGMKALLG